MLATLDGELEAPDGIDADLIEPKNSIQYHEHVDNGVRFSEFNVGVDYEKKNPPVHLFSPNTSNGQTSDHSPQSQSDNIESATSQQPAPLSCPATDLSLCQSHHSQPRYAEQFSNRNTIDMGMEFVLL